MEEWRELAQTVPRTLRHVAAARTTHLLTSLGLAHSKLSRWVYMARCALMDIAVGDDNFPDPPPAGSCPTVVLEFARGELALHSALHAKAGRVFLLGCTRLGLRGHPLWQEWEGHRAAALHHAAMARQGLRSAASHAQAAFDAGLMARVFPVRSPGWTAWASAELSFARRAIWGATTAMVAVRQMSHAVAWEYLYVIKVLSCRRLPSRCAYASPHYPRWQESM